MTAKNNNNINILEKKVVFLSASIPKPNRNAIYLDETNPADITDCVIAITELLLNHSVKIVFGGHPSISPLILRVSKRIKGNNQGEKKIRPIDICQSKWFEGSISKFTEQLVEQGFGNIIWTEKLPSLEESLTSMRGKMIEKRKIDCAIFIGGMEGINEEFKLIKASHPNIPIYLIGSSGAATKFLLKELIDKENIDQTLNIKNDTLKEGLLNSKSFYYLANLIIEDLIEQIKRIWKNNGKIKDLELPDKFHFKNDNIIESDYAFKEREKPKEIDVTLKKLKNLVSPLFKEIEDKTRLLAIKLINTNIHLHKINNEMENWLKKKELKFLSLGKDMYGRTLGILIVKDQGNWINFNEMIYEKEPKIVEIWYKNKISSLKSDPKRTT